MAINVNAAQRQANAIKSDLSRLKDAKRHLLAYRAEISGQWQGVEVKYILQSIDQLFNQMGAAEREMESLSRDIRTVADRIRQEEIAAERARQAEQAKRARIAEAERECSRIEEDLNGLRNHRNNLENALRNAPFWSRFQIYQQIADVDKTIAQHEEALRIANENLKAAKR